MASTTSVRRLRRAGATATVAVALTLAGALGAATARAEAVPVALGGPLRVSTTPVAPLPLRLSTSTVTGETVDPPPTPTGMPAGIEDLQHYVAADSCDPRDKAGPTALGHLLVQTYPGTTFGISRACGTDSLSTSEHYEGRALDWMTSARDPLGAARADAVLTWLLADDAAGHPYAMARRLGVMYLIWDDHIWGAYDAAAGWRPYATCAAHPEASYDTTCHRNHIHVSFGWNGALQHTSFWSRFVAAADYGPCRDADLSWAAPYRTPRSTPCPTHPPVAAPAGASALLQRLTAFSGAQVGPGTVSPVVTAVQQVLGVTADGTFGPDTLQALHAFQTAHAVPVVDAVDAATWRALLAARRTAEHPDPVVPAPAAPAPAPGATPTPVPVA